MTFELVVLYNNLPALIEGLSGTVDASVDMVLAAIEQDAKDNAPSESGALAASGFRITALTDDYSEAVSGLTVNPKAYPTDEPSVDTMNGEAVVGFAANYALPVHDGHHTPAGNFVPGQPFLTDAASAHAEELGYATKQAIEELAATGDATAVADVFGQGILSWVSSLKSRIGRIFR